MHRAARARSGMGACVGIGRGPDLDRDEGERDVGGGVGIVREQWGWTGLGFPSVGGGYEGVRWAGPVGWPAGLRPSVGGEGPFFCFSLVIVFYFLFSFISSFLFY